ncbi:protein FAR1-RELATED SEQUENCE 12-like [Juglans regia]|uniref:Protein FAR1-RELATED SEQUENCE 12-like n=1 Tax=Juglans regia TaxID=51240 RepID=A0A6P9E0Y1_JUGRE|nr:protein FAR1-RELATED SEQUENCE 12-like [Juglans regia]
MADSSDVFVAQEPIYNVDSDELEAESEDVQCDVNEDSVNVEDRVNVIPSSSSGPLEPFIGMVFEEVEDAQAFYKAYARRQGFAIRTNHTRLSKDDKTLCAVDYVCTRERF